MQDDNELMQKVQSGDKQAYDMIVLRHRVAAISFAYNFVCDIGTAEDIVQECFIKIYINRERYLLSFSFKTYLFTLIRNMCIDHLRKRKRAQTLDISNIDELAYVDADTPESQLLKNERIKEMQNIFKFLKDDYRTALYLYVVGQFSYEEISRIMNKSMPQIKITIYRARKKLKTLVQESDGNEK